MKTENIKLLLHSKDPNSNQIRLTKLRGNCVFCCLLQFTFFFLFFAVLIFIAFAVIDIEHEMKLKQKGTKDLIQNNTIPGSVLCKSVTADNMTLLTLGYLTGLRGGEKSTLEAFNQMYYLTDRHLTDQEACAVEAALRLFQDKSVFVIEIGNITNQSNAHTDYLHYLRQHYTNLNQIKSTADRFFSGSPFQNYFKNIDEFAVFCAKVLLVWQFGGTVIDPNFLVLSRRIYDQNEGFCEVDRDLLFCPNQCSAFVYQVVKTILDMMSDENYNQTQGPIKDTVQKIVDRSVADYCGDEGAVNVGCIGVNRLKEEQICVDLYQECQYLRVQEWKSRNSNWKLIVQKFCPKIVIRLQSGANDHFVK
ncbi:uncharacterized protein LOC128987636 [Macrosteles quadrilineatus]|uniref:uncharacterized protein LOC128987636 n=1 Tax=Macrosteles quadrilineatus TaxID=74068 RepID=UPI0023E26696|nr:uncharacterized protein LOC128987636 [Macrosteles quadrilineatus]